MYEDKNVVIITKNKEESDMVVDWLCEQPECYWHSNADKIKNTLKDIDEYNEYAKNGGEYRYYRAMPFNGWFGWCNGFSKEDVYKKEIKYRPEDYSGEVVLIDAEDFFNINQQLISNDKLFEFL